MSRRRVYGTTKDIGGKMLIDIKGYSNGRVDLVNSVTGEVGTSPNAFLVNTTLEGVAFTSTNGGNFSNIPPYSTNFNLEVELYDPGDQVWGHGYCFSLYGMFLMTTRNGWGGLAWQSPDWSAWGFINSNWHIDPPTGARLPLNRWTKHRLFVDFSSGRPVSNYWVDGVQTVFNQTNIIIGFTKGTTLSIARHSGNNPTNVLWRNLQVKEISIPPSL